MEQSGAQIIGALITVIIVNNYYYKYILNDCH